MRIHFTNLGCKLNQAEVERLSREFLAAGHSLAADLAEADLHVVNSCTVTHLAARDSRKVARRGRRHKTSLRTVLTGCYATGSPEEAAALAGVDLVVPNESKDELLARVHAAFPDLAPAGVPAAGVPVPYVPMDFGRGRGRALVKVEDGCNMRCSFCIIPTTRGRQRSRPVDDVVREVQDLADADFQEVVVTGVQISEYDDDGRRLYDLVKALLDRTAVPRLRLTSIAPWRFDDRLLDLWRDPRLCRHVHMSLQSGSTPTLRRMRRPYAAADFAELVEKLRAAIPGVAVTTDVIVGFPGESDEELVESLAFVEAMAFAKPHVFSYSRRPGTAAAEMPGEVSPEEKKARMAAMLEVARKSEEAFYRRRLGESLAVVWEERKNGHWSGLTDNYVRVFAAGPDGLGGTTRKARLCELTDGGILGELG